MLSNFLIPLIIAVLSGMGVGGGGLLVIYLTLVQGAEQLDAQGANMIFFMGSAAASTVFSAINGKIKWRLTIVMSVLGAAFAVLGSYIAGSIDSSLLRRLFGVMLCIGGASSLLSSLKQKK